MTAYVTLQAVKDGKITLDTLFTVSPTAASQSPSKMGFRPGTQVTVDNALKMMLVKSANDMAVVLAEGVGGSIDGFSAMMNQTAQKLGMTQTSYVRTACPPTARSPRHAIWRSSRAPSSRTCRNTNISFTFPRSATASASPRISTG
jgi:beta-lactamase class A